MELDVYYILIIYYCVGYYHYYWNRQGEGPEGEVADSEGFPLAPSQLAPRASPRLAPRLVSPLASRLSPLASPRRFAPPELQLPLRYGCGSEVAVAVPLMCCDAFTRKYILVPQPSPGRPAGRPAGRILTEGQCPPISYVLSDYPRTVRTLYHIISWPGNSCGSMLSGYIPCTFHNFLKFYTFCSLSPFLNYVSRVVDSLCKERFRAEVFVTAAVLTPFSFP